jgi:hypothetical protein
MAASTDPLLFTILGVTSTKEYLEAHLQTIRTFKYSIIKFENQTHVKFQLADKTSKTSLGNPMKRTKL